MSRRLCIGTRRGESITDFPDRIFDGLLDFAFDQGEADGVDYLVRLSPFRAPIAGPMFDGDHFDEWAAARGYRRQEMLASLRLWLELLDRHGERWERDPDWGGVGRTVAELRQMFQAAADDVGNDDSPEPLFTWVA